MTQPILIVPEWGGKQFSVKYIARRKEKAVTTARNKKDAKQMIRQFDDVVRILEVEEIE